MKKEIMKLMSAKFSKIWLEKNKKTIELDAQECAITLRYIQASRITSGFSLFSFLLFVSWIFWKVDNNGTIILAGICLSLIFNAVAARIGNYFRSTIGEAGKKLAKDWQEFLRTYKRLGINISTKHLDLLEKNFQSYVVNILRERADEIYNLEQLELEDERSRLRPTMEKIIELFEENFGLTLGKAGSYFPENSKVHDEPREHVEITLVAK